MAAALVVGAHAVDTATRSGFDVGWAAGLSSAGASGVDLFFVISGFVMAHGLARFPADAATFLGRRLARIAPLFLIASGAYLLINPFDEAFAWQSVIHSLTIVPVADGQVFHPPALYVGWTLAFEFAFYALVAATSLIAARRARTRIRMLFGLTMAAGLAGIVVTPGWMPLRLLVNSVQLEFALGIALWAAFDRGWLAGTAGAVRLLVMAMLALACILIVGPRVNPHYMLVALGESGLARTLAWGFPWALILAALLRSGIGDRPSARPLRQLGDASYAIYVAHPFVMALVWRLVLARDVGDAPAAVLMAVIGAFLLGASVHRWIERPLMKAIRRRRRRQRQPA